MNSRYKIIDYGYPFKVSENITEWHNKKGQVHRIGGPAIEHKGVRNIWCENGDYHRFGGPAVEWLDKYADEDDYKWYINGKKYTKDFIIKIKDMLNKCESLEDLEALRSYFEYQAINCDGIYRLSYPEDIRKIHIEIIHKIEILEKINNK